VEKENVFLFVISNVLLKSEAAQFSPKKRFPNLTYFKRSYPKMHS